MVWVLSLRIQSGCVLSILEYPRANGRKDWDPISKCVRLDRSIKAPDLGWPGARAGDRDARHLRQPDLGAHAERSMISISLGLHVLFAAILVGCWRDLVRRRRSAAGRIMVSGQDAGATGHPRGLAKYASRPSLSFVERGASAQAAG